ncbi:metal-dependent hydrolase [Capilliphycus salinus ALCB114379]|uniref:metal-dependent hydrolase n=1 Tax=Capilliphycus salinus TaxID=2768948 RepID=UPI0039A69D3E
MPSPIAHAVSGYVLSELFPLKSAPSKKQKRYHWQSFLGVFLAVAADLDFLPQLLTGERFHRGLTHTLLFTVGLSLIIGLLGQWSGKFSAQKLIRWTLILYGSHLLLDIFTAGGLGVQIFSPFSDVYIQSPLPLFPGVHHSRGLFDPSHLVFVSWELGYSAIILAGLWLWKQSQSRKLVE